MPSHASTIQAILARELDAQLRQAHIVQTGLLTMAASHTARPSAPQASPSR
jgi:hypothetical protein